MKKCFLYYFLQCQISKFSNAKLTLVGTPPQPNIRLGSTTPVKEKPITIAINRQLLISQIRCGRIQFRQCLRTVRNWNAWSSIDQCFQCQDQHITDGLLGLGATKAKKKLAGNLKKKKDPCNSSFNGQLFAPLI